MSQTPAHPTNERATLSLEIGQWFKANATGWGVVAVPIVVVLVLGAALVRVLA